MKRGLQMLLVCGSVILNRDDVRFIRIVELEDKKWSIVALVKDDLMDDVIYCINPTENYDTVKKAYKSIKEQILK